MSSHRRQAARIDANQPEIVEALTSIEGVDVALDKDDILVGYKGATYWIEIKNGPKARVTDGQKDLAKNWTGHYAICFNIEQILYEIGYKQPECKSCYKKYKNPECQEDHAALNGY